MSIITFWSNGKEQTGKTLSIAALSTYMAIKHNYKILVVATGYNDETLKNCFWQEERVKKSFGIFGPNTNIALEDGITGLAKAMNTNRLTADTVTDYTKVIFKDRLEILQSYKGEKETYENLKKGYPEIINMANKFYDFVFVDLDYEIENEISDVILSNSNLIVANISQRLSSIDKFLEMKKEIAFLRSNKTLLLIGRYDKYSKYTVKNITRYMKEKKMVLTIPYNTLFFEACEEAKVPELFYNFRSIQGEDRNAFFMREVGRASDSIINRLQDLSTMKM